ncbi:MAG: hypothetical protein II979_09880 [Clostridia bacterium]|nr:hypothetical protein [Clostridia bacterium]
MLHYLLLLLSVAANVTYSSLYNHLGKTVLHDRRDAFRINMWVDLGVSVLLAGYVLLSDGGFSLYTVLLGMVFGCVTALGAVCKLKALENGPMSLTILLITASMVIPAFSGALFWQEGISVWKIAGTLVMIFAGYLAAGRGEGKTSHVWLAYCIGAFLFIGSVGILQKIHQTSPWREQKTSFLLIAFLTAALLCAVLSRKPYEKTQPFQLNRKQWLIFGLCSICLTLNNVINLHLSGILPSVLFFPIVNGGTTVLSVLTALILFREKLTKRKLAALCVALAALSMLVFS